mmetsp:Transcript_24427/g.21685  ORF Transcript_24427/g.21685 Transcript_24427/m.21685 type:complete len:247 (+) Transcript_24427:366-1106(+)
MYALSANVSPASISCILMVNIILMLLLGLYIFKERHTILEYIGAGLILFACVIITLQKGVKIGENLDKNTDFYLSISLTILCSIAWASVGFMAKWASFYYNVIADEYAMVSMMISGALGSTSILVIYFFDIHYLLGNIQPEEKTNMEFVYFLGAIGAGFFTTFGVLSNIISISYGSVEVASLFTNMRVIVQLAEEFIIFSIIPSVFSFIGIGIAIIGSFVMIKFENDETHTNTATETQEKDNNSGF